MYTNELHVSDYIKRFYKVTINAYWIKIYNQTTKELLFERSADKANDDWYDEKHQAIIKAMNELEKAIFDAVK